MLLGALDGAIAAIETEMKDAWCETVVAVVTEFGRTARINGTDGTDHGTATVALLAGGALKGGRVVADWPGLKPAKLHEGRDLKATTDLRAVLKGLLKDHLRVDGTVLRSKVFPDSAAVKPMAGLLQQGVASVPRWPRGTPWRRSRGRWPQVGNRRCRRSVFAPGQQVVAANLLRRGGDRFAARNRGEADQMLAMAIDEGCDRSAADHIDAAADQGKTLIGEIDHARSIGDAAVEPGLDGVAIGRSDIEGLRRHQRAHMAGDDHVRGGVGRLGAQRKPGRATRQEHGEHDRGRERTPRRM
jgi:hypothetical protein